MRWIIRGVAVVAPGEALVYSLDDCCGRGGTF